jgi:nucleotide-binding universal stress UspA family protein
VAALGVTIATTLQEGRVSEQLREATRGKDVRLLVLGSHGRKGEARLFLGSVAEVVARSADCPVIITRGTGGPRPGFAGQRRLQVLVLADGHPASEAALRFCQGVRAGIPADLTFMQTYWREGEEERFGLDAHEAADRASLPALLERELRRWVGPMPGDGQLRFRVVPSDGDWADTFATEAAVLEPDLIVLGVPHPRGLIRRGRPISKLLRLIHAPVACVPEDARRFPELRPEGLPVVRSVLMATDLSEFSNQAVPAAYALVSSGGGEVELCHVFERGSHVGFAGGVPPIVLDASARSEAESKLARLVPAEAAARGIASRAEVVEADSAVEGILHESERFGADLIVVACHGRSGVRRAVMGSVATELVKRSTRPVLVLYPPLR